MCVYSEQLEHTPARVYVPTAPCGCRYFPAREGEWGSAQCLGNCRFTAYATGGIEVVDPARTAAFVAYGGTNCGGREWSERRVWFPGCGWVAVGATEIADWRRANLAARCATWPKPARPAMPSGESLAERTDYRPRAELSQGRVP